MVEMMEWLSEKEQMEQAHCPYWGSTLHNPGLVGKKCFDGCIRIGDNISEVWKCGSRKLVPSLGMLLLVGRPITLYLRYIEGLFHVGKLLKRMAPHIKDRGRKKFYNQPMSSLCISSTAT
ncbi:hypothetical protein Tco_1203569 [Tanacetum coccineum]